MNIDPKKKAFLEANILANIKRLGKGAGPIAGIGVTAVGAGFLGSKYYKNQEEKPEITNSVQPPPSNVNSDNQRVIDAGNKIAYRSGVAVIGTLAATTVALGLISRALQARKTAKCHSIEDLAQRSACYDEVSGKIVNELNRSMKYCEKSKNPNKCRDLIMHKVRVEKESKFGNGRP